MLFVTFPSTVVPGQSGRPPIEVEIYKQKGFKGKNERKHAFNQRKKYDSRKKGRRHANYKKKSKKTRSRSRFQPREKCDFQVLTFFFYKFPPQVLTVHSYCVDNDNKERTFGG